jgi:hypothetical protein
MSFARLSEVRASDSNIQLLGSWNLFGFASINIALLTECRADSSNRRRSRPETQTPLYP